MPTDRDLEAGQPEIAEGRALGARVGAEDGRRRRVEVDEAAVLLEPPGVHAAARADVRAERRIRTGQVNDDARGRRVDREGGAVADRLAARIGEAPVFGVVVPHVARARDEERPVRSEFVAVVDAADRVLEVRGGAGEVAGLVSPVLRIALGPKAAEAQADRLVEPGRPLRQDGSARRDGGEQEKRDAGTLRHGSKSPWPPLPGAIAIHRLRIATSMPSAGRRKTSGPLEFSGTRGAERPAASGRRCPRKRTLGEETRLSPGTIFRPFSGGMEGSVW